MTATNVFKDEQILRTYTTWTFDENTVTPIEGIRGFYQIPGAVEDAFEELGYKMSVHEKALWKNDDKGRFTQVGTAIEVNLWLMNSFHDAENVTVVHGEKLVIDGYANVYKLAEQGA